MIYRQLFCFIICVFVLAFRTSAQDSSHQILMPINIQSSFLYDFPQSFGATAGVQVPISSRFITKEKKGKQKEKYRDFITASDVGFYRYSFNNTGLFLRQSVGYSYHKTKPYYFQWLASVGVLRTFYDGTVYTVSNTGNVTKLPHFGRLYATTGFMAVFGHDFERSKKPQPLSVSLQPSLWVQYPYNSFLLPHLSLQLSASYHFHHYNIALRQQQLNRIHRS